MERVGCVPTRSLRRHGRRRAFHLYHAWRNLEGIFADIGKTLRATTVQLRREPGLSWGHCLRWAGLISSSARRQQVTSNLPTPSLVRLRYRTSFDGPSRGDKLGAVTRVGPTIIPLWLLWLGRCPSQRDTRTKGPLQAGRAPGTTTLGSSGPRTAQVLRFLISPHVRTRIGAGNTNLPLCRDNGLTLSTTAKDTQIQHAQH